MVAEALGLPPQVRAFAARKLIESLDATAGAELFPAWRKEIRKRCHEANDGLVKNSEIQRCIRQSSRDTGMKPIRFHPKTEMIQTALWHEKQQVDLGKRFVTIIQDCLNKTDSTPFILL